MGRKAGSARSPGIAILGLCLAAAACQDPVVGPRTVTPAPTEGPKIELEDGQADLTGHVVATFSVTQDGIPLSLAEVAALDPRFTLATLSVHPVDGIPAWRSQILTGTTVPNLAPSGPGTPASAVLTNVKQPRYEKGAASLVDLGGGRFRYALTHAISPFDPAQTVRVGVFLGAASSASLRTCSTYDFRPSPGPVASRDLTTDEGCNGCHENLVGHGSRAGVKLCLTCHTWQAADPDTIDPAAPTLTSTTLDPAGPGTTTSTSTDPNPLELGRMVHRIHRGKNLPTLYQSSSSNVPAPPLLAGNVLPLPFSPETSVTPVLGQKYSIIGNSSTELVGGLVGQRAEGLVGPVTMVDGITFPRDLRDCFVCHAVPDANGVPRQPSEVTSTVSRRICNGCHTDTWFGAAPFADATGPVHFPHPGGVQLDDSACRGCHVQATPGRPLYAPVSLIHVPRSLSPRNGQPRIEIVRVTGLTPGQQPQITFRLSDRLGPIVPQPKKPNPAMEPDSASSDLVPRKFTSLRIRIVGPTDGDYGGPSAVSLATSNPTPVNPSGDPLTLWTTAATDEYVYTFSTLTGPPGTYVVAMEGRRQIKSVTAGDPARWPLYQSSGADLVPVWPYTGESITESPDNPIVFVDSGSGTFDAATAISAGNGALASPGAAIRRTVVSEEKCLRCHGRFEGHGSQRHQVQECLLCHTPTATDWPARPQIGGKVNLAATWDGVEERTVQLKVMVHRIHTGGRTGTASLEAIAPAVIYGPSFYEGLFPGNLASCPTCHVGKTYDVDAVPANAPPTVANETASILHAPGSSDHSAGEYASATLPIQAACLGCHATGPTFAHVASHTVNRVETCPSCHAKGNLTMDVVHGLVPPIGGTTASTFSGIRDNILVPRCASSACHAKGANYPVLEASDAYAALVNAPSFESGFPLVVPGDASRSYLDYKLRGDMASAGGSGAIMPTDGMLAPADIAAIEAWISNGAPND
jgi:OmcA/MtrC family decaheme c-type cytochrome